MDKALIIERLINHFGEGKVVKFANLLDVTPQTITNWKSRQTIDYELIYTKCEGINGDWLLSGHGSMFKDQNTMLAAEPQSIYRTRYERTVKQQTVPFYGYQASAGMIAQFDGQQLTPIEEIIIPNMPKCDGALRITGDSMYPLLKSGDVVLYQKIADTNLIIWGEMYLVAGTHNGNDYFLAKYIQKCEDSECIRLVSENKHHASIDFPRANITGLAIIKASIRYNSSM